MIFSTTILYALRKQSWLVLSGKPGLGSWLKDISRTSIILYSCFYMEHAEFDLVCSVLELGVVELLLFLFCCCF
jgi:hypothetical protein